MTNDHTKLEDPWTMNSPVIDRTRFVYGPTHKYKAINPLLFFEGGGGHNNKYVETSRTGTFRLQVLYLSMFTAKNNNNVIVIYIFNFNMYI